MQRASTRPPIATHNSMIPHHIGTLSHSALVLVALDLKFDNHRIDKKRASSEFVAAKQQLTSTAFDLDFTSLL